MGGGASSFPVVKSNLEEAGEAEEASQFVVERHNPEEASQPTLYSYANYNGKAYPLQVKEPIQWASHINQKNTWKYKYKSAYFPAGTTISYLSREGDGTRHRYVVTYPSNTMIPNLDEYVRQEENKKLNYGIYYEHWEHWNMTFHIELEKAKPPYEVNPSKLKDFPPLFHQREMPTDENIEYCRYGVYSKTIWKCIETKVCIWNLADLRSSAVGKVLHDLPKHCLYRINQANGDKQWQIRCIHDILPTPLSYRWNTDGCLTAPVEAICLDYGLRMQGAAGGMDPTNVPEGVWWVDHLCTSQENVFEEMSKAAILYYGCRLLAHSAEVDRGWLVWERSLSEEEFYTGSYDGSSWDGLVGLVGTKLAEMLARASLAPMFDKSDLYNICVNLGLVGAIMLGFWAKNHGTNNIPPLCEEEGKRLIPKDDPWFGEEGLFHHRIDWKNNWVSQRGIGLSVDPHAPEAVRNTRFLLWFPPPYGGSGPVLHTKDLGNGRFRVLQVTKSEEGWFSSIIPASGVEYLG